MNAKAIQQPLIFRPFGSDSGQMVIYFHGAPGAPEEGEVFNLYAKEHGLRLICFDRFSCDVSLAGAAYYQCLVQQISKQAAGKQVDVIGFSIGAFIAIQTCRYLRNSVRNLHLNSAAAPLDAFFAPVAFRIQTYEPAMAHDSLLYAKRLLALPSMQDWYAAALRETWRDEAHEVIARNAGVWLKDYRAIGEQHQN